ncbi:MAG: ABC transporter permease [bacterium]|nr:ABC transporter permease [bacterium]
MNKMRLLPKMAVNSILRNKVVYLPYILTMSLAVAVYYTFSCIIGNQILENVPYAGYMKMLLVIGRALLAIILVPFLFYTNSFLIKRRKKELGLYTVLGLEKKHVGMMMIVETLCMYLCAMFIGLISSTAFSRLIFLVLINAAGMPKDAVYTADLGSLTGTLILFGIVSILNLLTNLWQVTMTNPTELLRSGQRGEKEPKHLAGYTIAGILILGFGYFTALTTRMNSFIFIGFFFSVFLVVIGSYFLFTSGSIAMLRGLKKRRDYYYHKTHFVTVSGMLYRMKRNASSLVNICIFSTMIMITLICTLTLIISGDDIMAFDSPFDGEYSFHYGDTAQMDDFQDEISELAKENELEITDEIAYHYGSFSEIEEGNVMGLDTEPGLQDNEMPVHVLTIEEYNAIEGTAETLETDEILFFSTAMDYAYSDVIRDGHTYRIKKQLSEFRIDTKEPHTYSNRRYYMIVQDEAVRTKLCGDGRIYKILLNIDGPEDGRKAFLSTLDQKAKDMPTYSYTQNIIDRTGMMKSMNGGLLFIGVFFGLIFTIFLVLIMYYKQIAEGMEDSDSFHIMQNVGMSREDVKGTIKSQILLVFGLPLAAAVIHTFVGLPLTMKLLYAMNIYNVGNILLSTGIVIVVFMVFYGVSYLLTARTYYKLVIK